MTKMSTHLREVLQCESFGHVMELGAAHGFGHRQHPETVDRSQLLLWRRHQKEDQKPKKRERDRKINRDKDHWRKVCLLDHLEELQKKKPKEKIKL